MSLPFSQLVFQPDLLVEEGAFESIDTSGMETSLQHLDADTLLRHTPDDLLQPASSSHFDWLQNSGPLMSADAFDDHRYGPSDTDYDRLVNTMHDYYDKVPQMDFDNEQAEHSYAYFLPTAAAAASASHHHHYAAAAPAAAGALQAEQLVLPNLLAAAAAIEAAAPSCSSNSSNRSSGSASCSPTIVAIKQEQQDPTTVILAEMLSSPTVPIKQAPPPATTTAHAGEEMACEWRSEHGGRCNWRGARCTVEAHVSTVHVGRGIVKPVCAWDGCGKSFVRRYLLLRHVRCLHCDDKPFTCGECGQRFSLRERMKLHQRVAHGQHLQLKLPKTYEKGRNALTVDQHHAQLGFFFPVETDYPCGQCGQTFPTTAHRRHHVERIHENARFACEYCNDLFADRSSLVRHKRRKHKGNTEKNQGDAATVSDDDDIYNIMPASIAN